MADELAEVAEDSARGGLFLILGSALSTVIMAISSILIGWFLGDEAYGKYTVALIVPQLLFLFADLGINYGITRFSATLNIKGETGKILKMVKHAIILKTVVGLALFALNYAFAENIAALLQRPDISFEVRITSISVLFQTITAVATAAFVGLDRAELNVLATNVHALAKTIISIALVLLGFGVIGALAGFVASYVASVAVSILLLVWLLHEKKTSESDLGFTDSMRILLRYGAPLYASMLLTGSVPLFQNFVLTQFTTYADIGNFKTATNFAALMTILSIPISTTLLPAFAKLDASATEKIRTFFKLANKYITMLIVPAAVLMITYATEVVQIVYQSKFQSAAAYLATYCLLYFLVGLGYLTLISFFNGLGQTRSTLIVSLIMFLVLLTLSFPLTGTYGVQGLIAAFLTASTAATLTGLYLARTGFHVALDARSLLKIYLAALVSIIPSLTLLYTGILRSLSEATLPTFLLRFGFLPELIDFAIGGILYTLIYLTLTTLAGVMTEPELKTASHITQRIRLLSPIAGPVLKYMRKVLAWKTRN